MDYCIRLFPWITLFFLHNLWIKKDPLNQKTWNHFNVYLRVDVVRPFVQYACFGSLFNFLFNDDFYEYEIRIIAYKKMTIGDFSYERSIQLKTVSAFLIFKKFYIIIRWRLSITIHRLLRSYEIFLNLIISTFFCLSLYEKNFVFYTCLLS